MMYCDIYILYYFYYYYLTSLFDITSTIHLLYINFIPPAPRALFLRGKKIDDEIWNSPQFLRYSVSYIFFFFFIFFSHLDSIMSAIVCFLLKAVYSSEGNEVLRRKKGWIWWKLSREIHHTHTEEEGNKKGRVTASAAEVTAVNFELCLYLFFSNLLSLPIICGNDVFNISQKQPILSTGRENNIKICKRINVCLWIYTCISQHPQVVEKNRKNKNWWMSSLLLAKNNIYFLCTFRAAEESIKNEQKIFDSTL